MKNINNAYEIPKPLDREVYLTGTIDGIMAEKIIKNINDIRNSDLDLMETYKKVGGIYKPEPINLIINSYGGQVYPMMAIVGIMEAYHPIPIYTYAFGYAMSAACIIFLLGKVRHMTYRTTLMLHEIADMQIGRLSEFEITVKEMQRLQTSMNSIIIGNSKIKSHILKQKLTKGDWFITPAEAKKYGLAEAFLKNTPPEKQLPKKQ